MLQAHKLKQAKDHLDEATKDLELAQKDWGECVTKLHMAELRLRAAQTRIRQSYRALVDMINGG